MIEARSRIKKLGGSTIIRLPQELRLDDKMPFQIEDEVLLTIKGETIIITKVQQIKENNEVEICREVIS